MWNLCSPASGEGGASQFRRLSVISRIAASATILTRRSRRELKHSGKHQLQESGGTALRLHQPARVQHRSRREYGFSLVEALVAMAILLVTIATFIQLFGVAAAASQRAARRSLAALAAMQKMEELLSEAGSALALSPATVLQADVDGYSDHLPGGAARVAFTRRWSIQPLRSASAPLLVLQVVVIGPGGAVEARLVTLRRTGFA